jgi:hypothetical protein
MSARARSRQQSLHLRRHLRLGRLNPALRLSRSPRPRCRRPRTVAHRRLQSPAAPASPPRRRCGSGHPLRAPFKAVVVDHLAISSFRCPGRSNSNNKNSNSNSTNTNNSSRPRLPSGRRRRRRRGRRRRRLQWTFSTGCWGALAHPPVSLRIVVAVLGHSWLLGLLRRLASDRSPPPLRPLSAPSRRRHPLIVVPRFRLSLRAPGSPSG